MFSMISKKALSQVLSVTLLSLLVVIAISLLYFYMHTWIDPALSPPLSCTQLALKLPVKITDVCIDPLKKEIRVRSLRDETQVAMETMGFAFAKGSTVKSWACGAQCGTCSIQKTSTTKTYYLDIGTLDAASLIDGDLTTLVNGCEIVKQTLKKCL